MSNLSLRNLRAAAEAATPGNWYAVNGWDVQGHDLGPEAIVSEGDDEQVQVAGVDTSIANADHIATFDPPTVLALLDIAEAASGHRPITVRMIRPSCGDGDCDHEEPEDCAAAGNDAQVCAECYGVVEECSCSFTEENFTVPQWAMWPCKIGAALASLTGAGEPIERDPTNRWRCACVGEWERAGTQNPACPIHSPLTGAGE